MDVHGPNDHQSLLDERFQRDVLDAYGRIGGEAYAAAWKELVALRDERAALTGDTLFHLSIGRTDFERGSMMQMMMSLHVLAQLPDETVVLAGHGEDTTIGDELRMNPFMDR